MLVDNRRTVDHSQMKLGKRIKKVDTRTLMLARYLDLTLLPPTPASFSWIPAGVTDFGEMLNDTLGDCTCAEIGHQIQVWTAANKNMVTPSDAAVVAVYSAVSGYDPATGQNDDGCYIIDVLNYCRNTGMGGDKIFAFAEIQPWMQDHLKKAIFLFGGIDIGIDLPIDAQTQVIWDVDHTTDFNGSGAPNSWGGHSVCAIAFSPVGLYVITWGQLKFITWRWWIAYCTETYGIISNDFIANGQTPAGFNLALLQSDLNLIGK